MVPDKWGQGQLFAFSALDGESLFTDDLAGFLCGDRIGVIFNTLCRRTLYFGDMNKFFAPEIKCTASDMIIIESLVEVLPTPAKIISFQVKTTSSGFSTPFYMSHREMEFSRLHKDNYYIYRVYNYNATKKSGNIAIIKGDVAEYGSYPVQYRIAIKSDEL